MFPICKGGQTKNAALRSTWYYQVSHILSHILCRPENAPVIEDMALSTAVALMSYLVPGIAEELRYLMSSSGTVPLMFVR